MTQGTTPTPSRPADPPLRQEQFDALREIIYSRTGIHFPDARKGVLQSRLARRLTELGLESFHQYVTYLRIAPQRSSELEEMLARVAVTQTAFFRDPSQLSAIAGELLPTLIEARRRERSLRLWCAACATGEDAYTLAILVHRALGERLPDWRIQIVGTDMSAKALAAAEEARYADDALRAVEPALRDRYFNRDGPYWRPDPLVRSLVGFSRHNLKDRPGARQFGLFDAAVCRNALIYFDAAMRSSVASMFAGQLRPDGWLVVGAAESFDGLHVPLAPCGPPGAHAYRPVQPTPPHATAPGSARPALRIAHTENPPCAS
ncbi:MAG: protein-glutamate O-methyltransferase CheR [Phycisphaerales bacterium]|nr:protein-glutamate O-methyltransferase CheR [Phycisphaerales bacterium]